MTNRRRHKNDDEFKARVSTALRSARVTAGYDSQTDAAAVLDTAPSTISNWETGRVTPDLYSLSYVADAYGTTLDALVPKRADIERAAAVVRGREEE